MNDVDKDTLTELLYSEDEENKKLYFCNFY